jgi:hypothetical protein
MKPSVAAITQLLSHLLMHLLCQETTRAQKEDSPL